MTRTDAPLQPGDGQLPVTFFRAAGVGIRVDPDPESSELLLPLVELCFQDRFAIGHSS